MAKHLYVKKGDTSRALTEQIKVGSTVQPLTGATIQIKWEVEGGSTTTKTATLSDGPNGIVSYQIVDADVAAAAIVHLQWIITFGDGTKLTVPTVGKYVLHIEDD